MEVRLGTGRGPGVSNTRALYPANVVYAASRQMRLTICHITSMYDKDGQSQLGKCSIPSKLRRVARGAKAKRPCTDVLVPEPRRAHGEFLQDFLSVRSQFTRYPKTNRSFQSRISSGYRSDTSSGPHRTSRRLRTTPPIRSDWMHPTSRMRCRVPTTSPASRKPLSRCR